MSKPLIAPSISNGNSKLGPGVWSFSLPAVTSCPGSTAACRSVCYATRGHFNWPAMKEKFRRQFAMMRKKGWTQLIEHQLRHYGVRTLRIHVSGDFFDARYIREWTKVVRRNRRTQFFAYTRSHRVPELLPLLLQLGREPNFVMHFSYDRDTGKPKAFRGIHSAYMMMDDTDLPGAQTDIVFRVNHKTPMKHTADGLFVCPVENGVTNTADNARLSCSTCQLCFSAPKLQKLRRKFSYVSRSHRSPATRTCSRGKQRPRRQVRSRRPARAGVGHAAASK